MEITFIQTADPVVYKPMLDQTSRTVKAYCERWGFQYEQFVGIKRGHLPWHASYNRMYLLKEMMDAGYTGWLFYMDADALIQDQSFDLRAYLADKADRAGIFAGYCDEVTPHNINSGGFALNFVHPTAQRLIGDFWWGAQLITDEQFAASQTWEVDLYNDQDMLCCNLAFLREQGVGDDFLFERSNYSYVNEGPFIRQLLRVKYDSPEARFEAIAKTVEIALA